MPATPSRSPIRCDSCGSVASAEHIRERVERLQRATGWRPIHISLLLICTAPPERAEDDLYATDLGEPSAGSRAYVDRLFKHLAIPTGDGITREEQLAELQRGGVYVARLVECPLAADADLSELTQRYGEDLLKRIEFSYKPKKIALLDPVAPGLAKLLLNSKFAPLVDEAGRPIVIL
jgi:hypothetical protein